MVYTRGKGIWWYRFRFRGIQIRESTKSTNKSVAERLEREHRRKLELGQQGLEEITPNYKLFTPTATEFIENEKVVWSKATYMMHKSSMKHLVPFFGKMTLHEITAAQIRKYQTMRSNETPQPANATINRETTTVRQLLVKHHLWSKIRDDVRSLTENDDVGRALTQDEFVRLLEAAKNNINKALYPALLVSIHTGLRSFELKPLKWQQVNLEQGTIIVGKSKTEKGKGREVFLSLAAIATLVEWKLRFPKAQAHNYVFPKEMFGFVRGGKSRGAKGFVVGSRFVDLTKPIGSFHGSWKSIRLQTGIQCRWHDLRHTAASILRDGGAMDETMKDQFGWMSTKMIERYSHAKASAKRAAVTAFDRLEGPSLPVGQQGQDGAQAGQGQGF